MDKANLTQERQIMLFEEVCGAWTERRTWQRRSTRQED